MSNIDEAALAAFLSQPCTSAAPEGIKAPSEEYDWNADGKPCHPNTNLKPTQFRLLALRQFVTSPSATPEQRDIAYSAYWAIYSHGYSIQHFYGDNKVSWTVAAAVDAFKMPDHLEAELYADCDKRQLSERLPNYYPVYCGDPSKLDPLFQSSEGEVRS